MREYELKDSGVEWQGITPTHWKRDKLYRLCSKMGSGGTPTSTNESYYGGDIPWIQSGDLTDSYVFKTKKLITDEALKNSSAKMFEKGTLLVAMYGATIGKLGIMEMDAATNQACCSLLPSSKFTIKFLYYLMLDARQFLLTEAYGGGQPNISQETLKQLHMVTPHPKEQKAIANYLDKACKKIDKTIVIKQQQLEKLEAYRKSVIHEAVTKGLDKNVAMKDSGVEWLGNIPEHWKIEKFTSSISIQEGPGIMAEDFHLEGIPLIRISGVKSSKVSLDGCNYLDPLKVNKKWSHFRLNIGDIIISCSASTNLISEVYDDTVGSIPYTGLIRLSPSYGRILKNYIKVFVSSSVYSEQIEHFKNGSTIQHYGPTHLKQMFIVLPPKNEQLIIAKHVNETSKTVNQTIVTIKVQIQKLTQYRQSLIHECVTGKKRIYQGDIKQD